MTLAPSEMGWGPVSVAEGERRVVGVVWRDGPEDLVVEVRYGDWGGLSFWRAGLVASIGWIILYSDSTRRDQINSENVLVDREASLAVQYLSYTN